MALKQPSLCALHTNGAKRCCAQLTAPKLWLPAGGQMEVAAGGGHQPCLVLSWLEMQLPSDPGGRQLCPPSAQGVSCVPSRGADGRKAEDALWITSFLLHPFPKC